VWLFLIGLAVGLYSGAGIVTSITVRSIDGRDATWKDSIFVALFWWFVLLDARRPEDEDGPQ